MTHAYTKIYIQRSSMMLSAARLGKEYETHAVFAELKELSGFYRSLSWHTVSCVNSGTTSIEEQMLDFTGLVVPHSAQLIRFTNGSTHSWIGRKKEAGKGEGWSNLRVDQIENVI